MVDRFMIQKSFNSMTIHLKGGIILRVYKSDNTIRSDKLDYEWASPMRFELSRKKMQLEII